MYPYREINVLCLLFSKSSAQRHEKDAHSYYRHAPSGGMSKYMCRYKDCNSVFDQEADHRLHCKTAHQDSAAILVCDICYQGFLSQNLLRLHRRSAHAPPQGRARKRRKWDRKSLLLREEEKSTTTVMVIPEEEAEQVGGGSESKRNSLSCPHCSRTFTRRSQLQLHQDSHTVTPLKVNTGLSLFNGQEVFFHKSLN